MTEGVKHVFSKLAYVKSHEWFVFLCLFAIYVFLDELDQHGMSLQALISEYIDI